MIRANEFEPDWLHLMSPGESILEDLAGLGLSQADLAKRIGYSAKHIHKLIKGEAPITAETALRLEKVLSYPAHFWLNLESNYREAIAKEKERDGLTQQKAWLKTIPLSDMIKFGWVDRITDKGLQVAACLKFYGVSSLDLWHQQQEQDYQAVFKSYEHFSMNEVAVQTWLKAGENQGVKINCQLFHKQKLQAKLLALRALTLHDDPDDFLPKLQALCADCGIAVVFEPTPKKCPISGATKWISPHKALLLLSLRYKTNDHLWFAFFHEVGHILKHKKQLFLEPIKRDFKGNAVLESEADKFASDLLIPPSENEALAELTTKAQIKLFAKRIGIASGIVVGRLQHEGIIHHSNYNELKVKYQWT